MQETQAIRALAALAHESRLRVFRLLSKCGVDGMPAGTIADQLQLPAATLSFHLKELANAELIQDRREGRSIFYSLNSQSMSSLIGFLLEDCCGGQPELCGPAGLVELKVPRRRKAKGTL
ncbi:MAG: winged helix-turn-helix transcriptional regulator [Planctomycetes bacterium]|nr:winged helix-turn-helix transcriptional regulator [Planctomycetota bacterium]